MSAFEMLISAVGETVAYVAGRVVGRTFSIERKRAQTIGEIIVYSALVIALATITFVYS